MKKTIVKILFALGVFVVLYFLTWWIFISDGPFCTGVNIEKSDWLMFWGSFLAFAGTTFLGCVSYLQTQKANEINEGSVFSPCKWIILIQRMILK